MNHFRFSKKHLILGGLWFGTDRPNMITLLEPVVQQLNTLYQDGKNAVCKLKFISIY